jgi:hypothetical protein
MNRVSHPQKESAPVVANAKAPVLGAAEVHIDAPLTIVWEVLSGLSDWPKWNTDVSSMQVQGPVRAGTSFKWSAAGMTIRSQLQQVDPPNRIAWTGRTLGIHAVHVWHLEEADGGTEVRTEESFDGLPARLLPGYMKRTLQTALDRSLDALKTEAQSRTASVY